MGWPGLGCGGPEGHSAAARATARKTVDRLLARPVQSPEAMEDSDVRGRDSMRQGTIRSLVALAAAILAGKGHGMFSDVADTASRMANMEHTVEPNPDVLDEWHAAYQRWRHAIAENAPPQ